MSTTTIGGGGIGVIDGKGREELGSVRKIKNREKNFIFFFGYLRKIRNKK